MAQQGEVLEGFLCPLCMKDLGDVIQLQVHFDESHSKEDQAFVQSLKDLFGKAKKKILSDEETISTLSPPKLKLSPSYDNIHPVSGIRLDIYQASQEKGGVCRGHFAEFKKIRSSRVDRFATETNRLIVRLDKLLENMPSEANRRREHEKNIVPWIDEDLVKLCPSCARSFNIARRKHHCRLCGSVMCQDCSQFVDFNFCRKLINPSTLSSYKQVDRQGWSVNNNSRHDSRSVGSPARSMRFPLKKHGSRESLMSIVDGRGKEEFRACGYCKSLLTHRENIIELATAQPIISQFYDKLRDYTAMGEEMSPKYVSMYDSLMMGETSYHSSDAKLLRVKLLKVAENIDMMSKKIQALGLDTLPEGREGPLPRRFLLQNQIRRASVNFIKETLVGLPSLPSDDELLVLQEKRKEEIAKKVEEERRKAAEARLKFQNIQERRRPDMHSIKLKNSPSGEKFNQSNISYESGFVLSSSSQAHVMNSVSDDPMVQQMTIIRGYIQQARDANRFDEVSMLETNLKMLQEEFKRQNISDHPPVAEEPAGYVSFSGVRPEFEEKSKELTNGDASNPFGSDSEDEYDASGKNPFAE